MERNGAAAGFPGYTKNTKSQQITTSTTSEMKQNETSNNSTVHENEFTVREQDQLLPITNVIRLMRKIIPPHSRISDDAKGAIQECVSEFISFVTSEANVRCQQEQRKTITAEDVLWAMSSLGFDDYVEPLTVYINRYRENEASGEAFVKRSADAGVKPIAHGFQPGYFVGPNGGFVRGGGYGKERFSEGCSKCWTFGCKKGFVKDVRNAGPSGAAASTPDPFAKCKE